MTFRTPVALAAATVVALALSACSSGTPAEEAGDGLRVVASTNVYGDIAEAIGGDSVEVTSLITSAAQDPHSFEASAQDQLALSEADVVIENGGGYDPFIDTLLSASGNDVVVVLNASEISGLMPEEDEDEHADEEDEERGHIEGFNEHVWYSFDAVARLAERLADELGRLDPEAAATYTANYQAFAEQIDGLLATAAELADSVGGAGVAITEPVPLYLLEEAGLVNRTPEEFSEAIEEGADVSPLVLAETLDLFSGGTVGLLAYNEQTSGRETEQVRAAAEEAGIPVVSFTETLPEGDDYVSWMTGNLDAVSAALS